MTHLKTLDLSHNELLRLPSHVFQLPSNVSAINLAHNQLSALPVENIANLVNLTLLDVSYNRLGEFSAEFLPLIKNNATVLYKGMPIRDAFLL